MWKPVVSVNAITWVHTSHVGNYTLNPRWVAILMVKRIGFRRAELSLGYHGHRGNPCTSIKFNSYHKRNWIKMLALGCFSCVMNSHTPFHYDGEAKNLREVFLSVLSSWIS